MASYSDHDKDVRQREFIERWAPRDKPLPPLSEEALRWNIARANAAEAKVREYRDCLDTLRGLMDG